MKTIIRQTGHGKVIETVFPISENKQVTLSTMKRFDGYVSTSAHEEDIEGDFVSFSCFGSWSKTFIRERIRATEKAMIEQHKRGIELLKPELASQRMQAVISA